MARPVKKRDVKSYQRDIETLGRLRTSIVMNTELEWQTANSAVTHIDALMMCLRDFVAQSQPEKKSA